MSDAKSLHEMLQTEEFKSEAVRSFMELIDKAKQCQDLLDMVKGTTFNELTPEFWARISSKVEDSQEILTYIMLGLRSSGSFLDDPAVMNAVADIVVDRKTSGS